MGEKAKKRKLTAQATAQAFAMSVADWAQENSKEGVVPDVWLVISATADTEKDEVATTFSVAASKSMVLERDEERFAKCMDALLVYAAAFFLHMLGDDIETAAKRVAMKIAQLDMRIRNAFEEMKQDQKGGQA